MHLDRNRIGAIESFAATAEGDGDEAKPLSVEVYAVRTWFKRMDETFAPFGKALALA